MSARQALRVHVGPVQDFIAAGRRTRDYWAGSFLLSRLSGEAMKAVKDADGSITIPVVEDRDGKPVEQTFRAIVEADYGEPKAGPPVGTLVNHFRAEVPADFEISLIEDAVRARFRTIAKTVFEVFIEPALTDGDRDPVTRRWNSQTDGQFFEILAVKGAAPDWAEESAWLGQRKRFRTHRPHLAEARADRCPVHPVFAELGGFSRQQHREEQDAFWNRLRAVVGTRMYEKGGAGAEAWTEARARQLEEELAAREEAEDTGRRFRDTLEIRPSERLSGLALVKRLFPLFSPKLISRAIGWIPDHLFDVHVPDPTWNPEEAHLALRNWPSTAFIAAIPWIVRAGRANPQATGDYAERQYKTLGADPIWEAERPQRHRVKGIDKLPKENGKLPRFAVLDGTLHFERGLEKRRFAEDPQEGEKIARKLQTEFRKLRRTLQKGNNEACVRDGPASTHYAMLEMDGDSMGQVFSPSLDGAKKGSRALLDFAGEIPELIRLHDGVLVYAGADDVNAMLPIETAIPCALAVNRHWRDVMSRHFQPAEQPTLSGSIVFADYQNALDDVRQLTHERLDQVAKAGMGRNALAVAVMKSGGVVSQWASAWEAPDGTDMGRALMGYAHELGEHSAFASRLPYLIRERYNEVLGDEALFDDEALLKFLAKELGGDAPRSLGETREERAERVLRLLRPWCRGGDPPSLTKAPRHVGGLLVARFLAQNAMWSYFEAWQASAEEDGP